MAPTATTRPLSGRGSSGHDYVARRARRNEMLANEKVLRRGDDGYDRTRRSTPGNGRVPDRFPEVIVRAEDVGDVVDAVELAKREGRQIAVRAGGHSFAVNSVREGGMLLDVGA